MLKLSIALVAVAVILAGLLAGLPTRALDGTPSPNILPPTNPDKCWVETGNIADVSRGAPMRRLLLCSVRR
jgi:hypothetical protein